MRNPIYKRDLSTRSRWHAAYHFELHWNQNVFWLKVACVVKKWNREILKSDSFFYLFFFSIDEKKSTLGDSRTPINRYAWAKQKSRLIFRYAIYLQPKYILVLVVLNSTRHCTVASRPFSSPIKLRTCFGRLAVSYLLNLHEK